MSNKDLTQSKIDNEPMVIANGETDSAIVLTQGTVLSGVYIPASFTGTSISFLASADKAAFFPVYDGQGALIERTVAAGQFIALDPTLLAGVNALKIKSNAAEAAERTLTLALVNYA